MLPPSTHAHWTLHPERLQLSVYSIALLSHFLPSESSQTHTVFIDPHPDGGIVASILLDGSLVAAYDEDGIAETPGAIVITENELDRILGQKVNADGATPDEDYRIVAAGNQDTDALAFCAFGPRPGRSPRVLSITPRNNIHQNLGTVPPAAGPPFPKIHSSSSRPRTTDKAIIPAIVLEGAANLLCTIGAEHDFIETASTERGLLISFESEPNLLILIPAECAGAAAGSRLQWLAGIQCPWHWMHPIEPLTLH